MKSSRVWRLTAVVAGGVLVSGVILWWTRAGSSASGSTPPDGTAENIEHPTSNIERPTKPDGATSAIDRSTLDVGRSMLDVPPAALHDPVVVPSCSLVPVQEQDVSSQIDGVLQDVVADLGQSVVPGQVLGRLDDRLLRPQVELLRIKATSQAARQIARAQYEEVELKTAVSKQLLAKGVSPSLEYRTLACQRDRYAEEMKKADEDQEVARQELEKALRMLELHEVRAAIAGEVTKVYKRKGESVRQMEPLFRVANFNRLCVEGLCKAQQAELIRVGMRAVVEPEQPSDPLRELSGHTAAVTALAVAADGRWLASAGEDRTVLLWRWPEGTRQAVLSHPAEVYAVALGRKPDGGTRDLLATGCGDGSVRVWEVSRSGGVEGPAVWAPAHEGPVRALAFSPDGRWCATGGEDRRIGLWDVAGGTRVCWLRGEADGRETAHQGAVTWVQFTPDGYLVSAGRDNALNLWRLEGGGAKWVATQPGRSGEVAALGVSPDGRRVLFDRGEELRILDRDGWTCVGSLRSRRQGRFQGFGAFSPTGRLVLAASSNGRVQLWKVPAPPEEMEFFRRGYAHGFRRDTLAALAALGGPLDPSPLLASAPQTPQLWGLHGYEVRHLVTPGTATATCGAFAPDESVAFTGGSDGAVRVWAVPPAGQWGQPWEATITFVAGQVERGTDGVRVRAEMDNPADPSRRLRPGSYADMRLYPETAP
jgi:WD40 repeat protein